MVDLHTARKNLDRRLSRLQPATTFQPPPRGWIRAIRNALGMTTAQLARRMGVSQPRIVRLEQDEARRAVTLETLEKVARALDCTLVYALVPNRSINETVRERAESLARAHLGAARHSMRLEDQSVRAADEKEQLDRLARELTTGKPSRLWDGE